MREMSRAALLLAVFAAAACGAEVAGGSGTDAASADAQSDAPATDAPSDTRACAGGDAAMTAPDGSCFLLFTTPTSYGDAQASCASTSAHLAFLKTAELDAAAEVFVGTNDTFIGFSDQAAEGTFVWDDGSPRVFDNFAATEPNSGGG